MLQEVSISRDIRCYVLVIFQSNLIMLVFFFMHKEWFFCWINELVFVQPMIYFSQNLKYVFCLTRKDLLISICALTWKLNSPCVAIWCVGTQHCEGFGFDSLSSWVRKSKFLEDIYFISFCFQSSLLNVGDCFNVLWNWWFIFLGRFATIVWYTHHLRWGSHHSHLFKMKALNLKTIFFPSICLKMCFNMIFWHL
jgi:hypothetical protein